MISTVHDTNLELGSHGPEVDVLQQKLIALGYEIPNEEQGHFGEITKKVLAEFQSLRHLKPDGTCTNDTWKQLTEATWKLGDRLLYIRKPMLRGDDVAELQQILSNLGFSSGKIDGIFGPSTLEALKEFQYNQNLNPDGIVGPNTIRSLKRVMIFHSESSLCVDNLKEYVEFTSKIKSQTGFKIALGDLGGSDSLVHILSKTLQKLKWNTEILNGLNEKVLAQQANSLGCSLCIILRFDALLYGMNICYYRGYSYESKPGLELGKSIASQLNGGSHISTVNSNLDKIEINQADLSPVSLVGLSYPILRETSMPTLLIEIGRPYIYRSNMTLLALKVGEALTDYFNLT